MHLFCKLFFTVWYVQGWGVGVRCQCRRAAPHTAELSFTSHEVLSEHTDYFLVLLLLATLLGASLSMSRAHMEAPGRHRARNALHAFNFCR